MKLLLDTHTFLWLIEGSPNLSAAAQAALADSANELLLSVASVWELAIKTGNNKLALSGPLDAFVATWTATYQIALLPIVTPHALAVAGLPHFHRDPFDLTLGIERESDERRLVAVVGKVRAERVILRMLEQRGHAVGMGEVDVQLAALVTNGNRPVPGVDIVAGIAREG